MEAFKTFWLLPIQPHPKLSKWTFLVPPIGALWMPFYFFFSSLLAEQKYPFSLFSITSLSAYFWGFLGVLVVCLPVWKLMKNKKNSNGVFFVVFCTILTPVFTWVFSFLFLVVFLIFAGIIPEWLATPILSVLIGGFFTSSVTIWSGEIHIGGLINSILSGTTVAVIFWMMLKQKAKKEGLVTA